MWITSQNDEVKQGHRRLLSGPVGHVARKRHSQSEKSDRFERRRAVGRCAHRHPSRTLAAGQHGERHGEEDGAASVWQQKQKVHLLANNDRNLPALVVNFEEASAELQPTAQKRLMDLLPALVGKRNKIELRAHSTRRPLPAGSPFRDHWQLCYERSLSTMQFLETNGIEPERIRLSQSAAYDPLTTRFEANMAG